VAGKINPLTGKLLEQLEQNIKQIGSRLVNTRKQAVSSAAIHGAEVFDTRTEGLVM
jgi:hypothetical protein